MKTYRNVAIQSTEVESASCDKCGASIKDGITISTSTFTLRPHTHVISFAPDYDFCEECHKKVFLFNTDELGEEVLM